MIDSYALYKNKLTGIYLRTFDKIELYCHSANLPNDILQDRLMELMDTLLTAQQANKPISDIVGADIENFCRDFAGDIDIKDYIFDFSAMIKRLCWFIFVFSGFGLLGDPLSFFQSKSDFAPFLLGALAGVLISSILGFIFRKILFKYRKIRMKTYGAALILFVLPLSLFVAFICENFSIEIYSWLVFSIAALYLVFFYTLQNRFFPKKRSATPKIRFSDLVIEGTKKQWMRSFEVKNKRRYKKGKPPLSADDFTEKLKRQNRRSLLSYKWAWIFLVLVVASATISQSFESTYDLIMFIFIMAAIEFCVYWFYFRSLKNVELWTKEILDECERRGINLIEYLESETSSSVENDETEEYL